MRALIAVLLLVSSRTLFSQPQCEPRPEVRQVLEEKLATKKLAELKFAERVAYRRQTLEDLIAKYPTEVEPYRQLIKVTKEEGTDHFPELAARFQKAAEQHPDDPMALYAAGLALYNRNTRLSTQFFEKAATLRKDFAWPQLELVRTYAPSTKHPEAQKAAEAITAFFAACPSSTDRVAQSRLSRSGSSELQKKVAEAVRVRLTAETDPRRLADYAALWDLEFRTHSPKDYPALRAQVAADLKRLESANAKPDLKWLVFIKDGYKRSGALPEAVASAEDQIIRAFPHSDEAYRITRERWEVAHPEPAEGKDVTAWAKYHREYRDILKTWIAQFTESRELQHQAFYATLFDPDMPEEQGLRTLDDYLAYVTEYEAPSIGDYLDISLMMVDHNWHPSRVFTLLKNSEELINRFNLQMLGDNLSAEEEDVWKNNEIVHRQAVAGEILVAARLTEQPAQADRFKPFIERELAPNSWPMIASRYWLNRARLAMLEGRKADALTFYQQALQKHQVPDAVEGRVIDDLTDEARAVWRLSGGTDAAWNLWSKLPANAVDESTPVGWKKPTKPMPAFELTDLSGKPWRLSDLKGRAVLINVWATWCGPCQRELPHIQKLYEQTKNRTDLQILTLNIDSDPSMIEPFLKQHGFSYPVLPAEGFVTKMLDLVYIPQNWIVDPKGEWRWTGQPAVAESEWEAAMLKQIESVK